MLCLQNKLGILYFRNAEDSSELLHFKKLVSTLKSELKGELKYINQNIDMNDKLEASASHEVLIGDQEVNVYGKGSKAAKEQSTDAVVGGVPLANPQQDEGQLEVSQTSKRGGGGGVLTLPLFGSKHLINN